MKIFYALLLFLTSVCFAKERGAWKNIVVDFPKGTSQSKVDEVKKGIQSSGGVIETEFFLFPGFSARIPASVQLDSDPKYHDYTVAMSALKAYDGRMEEEHEYHTQD